MPDPALAFTVFPTVLGSCALAWSDAGALVRSTLPEPDDDAARRVILRRSPDAVEAAPPAPVAAVATGMQELFRHGTADLTQAPVDLTRVPAFDRRVYEAVRAIPAGSMLTYGQVAALLGAPGASQAVGRAMARNPLPPVVPCHRVLAADGALGGFSGPGGPRTKRRLLEIEGTLPEQAALFEL